MSISNPFSAGCASLSSVSERELSIFMHEIAEIETAKRTKKYAFLKMEDREDIAMTIFAKAWAARWSYDPSRYQLGTWMSRIAHNVVVDFVDGWMRTKAIIVSAEEMAGYRDPEDGDAIRGCNSSLFKSAPASYEGAIADSDIIALEGKAHFEAAVASLSKDDQKVIALILDEEDVAEMVAMQFGCSMNAAYGRVHKAKARLAAALGYAPKKRKARRETIDNEDSLPYFLYIFSIFPERIAFSCRIR